MTFGIGLQSEVTVTTREALYWLREQKMIDWDKEQLRWFPTTLGSTVMASTMDPDTGLEYIQVNLKTWSAFVAGIIVPA